MIDFKCPHCGRILRISEDHVGAEGACRHCGGRILVQVESEPALDDWTGMLAEAEAPVPASTPRQAPTPAPAKTDYRDTDASLLQALLAQSRSEVERLARDLETVKNAKIEAEVARDIAEARAKRMEERLIAEAGRNDLTILATDLERAINQLAQSRAEVDRMAKEIEMERTAKIRAEISGRLLEANLRRLQNDLNPDGGFVADTPNPELLETPVEETMTSPEPAETQASELPDPSREGPVEPVKDPLLRLDKIMAPRRKPSSARTLMLALILAVAAGIAALWTPPMQQLRSATWQTLSEFWANNGWSSAGTAPSTHRQNSAISTTSSPESEAKTFPVSPDSIRGIARDTDTQAPLPAVALKISGEVTGAEPLSVVTNADGTFAVPADKVGYGRFEIQCVAPPQGYGISIPYGGLREKDTPLPEFEVKLQKTAAGVAAATDTAVPAPALPGAAPQTIQITGRVLTAKGDPAPGFSVLSGTPGSEPKPVAVSDTNGVFSFSGGSGPITLVAAGHGTVRSNVVTVEIPPDGTQPAQDLTLPAMGRIVVVPKKIPPNTTLTVEACTVSSEGRVLEGPMPMLVQPEGLVIPYLLPGVYDVSFSVAGYQPVSLSGLMIDDKASDRELEVLLKPVAPAAR